MLINGKKASVPMGLFVAGGEMEFNSQFSA